MKFLGQPPTSPSDKSTIPSQQTWVSLYYIVVYPHNLPTPSMMVESIHTC